MGTVSCVLVVVLVSYTKWNRIIVSVHIVAWMCIAMSWSFDNSSPLYINSIIVQKRFTVS